MNSLSSSAASHSHVELLLNKAVNMLDTAQPIYVWKDLRGERDSWAISNNKYDHADIPAYFYTNLDAARIAISRQFTVVN